MSGTAISRRDVEQGLVPPKPLSNGGAVPPGLQINTETLAEHQGRMVREGLRKLSRSEAEYLRFPPAEIMREFGRP